MTPRANITISKELYDLIADRKGLLTFEDWLRIELGFDPLERPARADRGVAKPYARRWPFAEMEINQQAEFEEADHRKVKRAVTYEERRVPGKDFIFFLRRGKLVVQRMK